MRPTTKQGAADINFRCALLLFSSAGPAGGREPQRRELCTVCLPVHLHALQMHTESSLCLLPLYQRQLFYTDTFLVLSCQSLLRVRRESGFPSPADPQHSSLNSDGARKAFGALMEPCAGLQNTDSDISQKSNGTKEAEALEEPMGGQNGDKVVDYAAATATGTDNDASGMIYRKQLSSGSGSATEAEELLAQQLTQELSTEALPRACSLDARSSGGEAEASTSGDEEGGRAERLSLYERLGGGPIVQVGTATTDCAAKP